MKLGCAMIVKNESAVLGRCLDSIRFGVDEIFIADTGSTDNTAAIAKKYTKNVYTDYQWQDNFAEARNYVLSKVTTDYVISIDADEILHDVFELREAAELAAKQDVLAVNVLMVGAGSNQSFNYPRLFKKDPGVFWNGAIHNHLSAVGSDVGFVKITHTYSPAHRLDPDRALRILKKEVEKTGNGREMFYLAREYWYRKEYQTAIDWYSKYVEISQFLPEKAEAYLTIARCYLAMNNYDLARLACAQAIIINAHFKEAILLMSFLNGDGRGVRLWQENADQWKRMAETADGRNVLFVRNFNDKSIAESTRS